MATSSSIRVKAFWFLGVDFVRILIAAEAAPKGRGRVVGAALAAIGCLRMRQ